MTKVTRMSWRLLTSELLDSSPISFKYSSSCSIEFALVVVFTVSRLSSGMNEKLKVATSIPFTNCSIVSWMNAPVMGNSRYIWNWFSRLKNPVLEERPLNTAGADAAIAIPTVLPDIPVVVLATALTTYCFSQTLKSMMKYYLTFYSFHSLVGFLSPIHFQFHMNIIHLLILSSNRLILLQESYMSLHRQESIHSTLLTGEQAYPVTIPDQSIKSTCAVGCVSNITSFTSNSDAITSSCGASIRSIGTPT